ncbi:MAG: tRNA preQ1(34) S-adenosylmethionine ribosyltransferase-isomerase QueA [Planctomycetes bacterium RBG_13_44_8b]|nr:MAG: tRNA preQ1(34) S-adenosylmethionine ribosyltransferase-isomerase QueA [Planctomycetes bacterium RBG_13_44_8b]
MKTEVLRFSLPAELIAQQPCPVRSEARLLVLNRRNNELIDSRFNKIGNFLRPGDCFVLNDTKVLSARFFARRGSGGKLEGLFLTESTPSTWEVLLKSAHKVKTGEYIYIKDRSKADFCKAEVLEKKKDGMCHLKLEASEDIETILDHVGFPPLPPYIKRSDDAQIAAADGIRYQTVYACMPGAIAAPTAGLHFTEELIKQLKQTGIFFAYLTLHIGMGTFKPITTENVEEFQIHKEQFSIDKENARIINEAKNKGGRIIPVGTTSTRVLETIACNSQIKPAAGTTELFITPGYKFKITDAMVTNFHLPESTLLALVAAFAGLEQILSAYKHAVEKRYRFFSYGDAMFIL